MRFPFLPIVLLSSVFCACSSSGESTASQAQLLVGYYGTQSLEVLQDGGDCPVLWGLQGGNWTMPTLRAQGIGPHITARGTLIMGTEQLGENELTDDLQDRGDGWWELIYLPIPVHHPAPYQDVSINDVYERDATLSITVIDDHARQVSATWQVVLKQSEVPE